METPPRDGADGMHEAAQEQVCADRKAPSPEQIEAAARVLARWINYAWDGLHDRDISAEFPDWAYNGIGSLSMQGGKPALRRVAREMMEAADA